MIKAHVSFATFLFLLLVMLGSCRGGRPAGVPSEAAMERLLYDYHMATAMAYVAPDSVEQRRHGAIEAALRKHGLTRQEFQQALLWYETHPAALYRIYEGLAQRYGAQQDELQTAVSSDVADAAETASATAQVWPGPKAIVLSAAGRNRHSFTLELDTAFHPSDRLEWTFTPSWLYADAERRAVAVLTAHYDPDTTATATLEISGNGIQSLSMSLLPDRRAKSLSGFVLLYDAPSRRPRVLVLSPVSLERRSASAAAKSSTVGDKPRLREGGEPLEAEPLSPPANAAAPFSRHARERQIRDSLLQLDRHEGDHFADPESTTDPPQRARKALRPSRGKF